MRVKLVVASLFLATIAAQAQAQQTAGKTAIAGIFVNQNDSPVEIQSITANGLDLFSVVKVKDTSSKPVSGIEFEWIFVTPQGCTNRDYPQEVGLSGLRTVDIQPGGETAVRSLNYNPRPKYLDANSKNVAYVHYQVGVHKVQFADGTAWVSPKAPSALFSPDLLVRASHNCLNGELHQ